MSIWDSDWDYTYISSHWDHNDFIDLVGTLLGKRNCMVPIIPIVIFVTASLYVPLTILLVPLLLNLVHLLTDVQRGSEEQVLWSNAVNSFDNFISARNHYLTSKCRDSKLHQTRGAIVLKLAWDFFQYTLCVNAFLVNLPLIFWRYISVFKARNCCRAVCYVEDALVSSVFHQYELPTLLFENKVICEIEFRSCNGEVIACLLKRDGKWKASGKIGQAIQNCLCKDHPHQTLFFKYWYLPTWITDGMTRGFYLLNLQQYLPIFLFAQATELFLKQ
jgi:hypothetical protein